MAAAPSTVAPNPLQEGMARIMGNDPLSTATGTSGLINYEDLGNRGQIPGDVITIQGDPGTGASTAETWAHNIELENQRRKELEFEFQKQQQDISNAMEAQRAALSQSQFGIQKAGESREAGLYGGQLTAQELANRNARQQLELARSAEQRAQMDQALKTGGVFTPEQFAITSRNQAMRNALMPTGMGTRIGTGGYDQLYGAANYAAPIGPTAQNPYQGYGFAIPGRYIGGTGTTPGYSPGYVGLSGGSAYYQPYGSGMSQSIGKPGTESFNQSMYALNPANQQGGPGGAGGAGINWSNYYGGKKGYNT